MRVLNAPMRYFQKSGLLQELGSFLKNWKKVFVIADSFVLEHYGNLLEKSFSDNGVESVVLSAQGVCSETLLTQWGKEAKEQHCGGVVGIGGGKALDMAKGTAHFGQLPMAAVPTAASSDAPCSGLAVLYRETGELDRYLPLDRSPEYVLVDSQVIFAAPIRLFRAGIGDGLSTYYEARACARSGSKSDSGSIGSASGLMIAKACRDVLFEQGLTALQDQEQGNLSAAFEDVIEANLYLSGLGFENGGLAAAHAVQNALNGFEVCRGFLHGEKVAFGTLVQLLLEGDQEEYQKVYAFCRKAGLPVSLEELGISSSEEIKRLAEQCLLEKDLGHLVVFPNEKELVEALVQAGK